MIYKPTYIPSKAPCPYSNDIEISSLFDALERIFVFKAWNKYK